MTSEEEQLIKIGMLIKVLRNRLKIYIINMSGSSGTPFLRCINTPPAEPGIQIGHRGFFGSGRTDGGRRTADAVHKKRAILTQKWTQKRVI